MSCTPETSDKLEKLLDFLGLELCWKCKGKGRIKHVVCSCCMPETITCPECTGSEFIIQKHSPLKNLLSESDEDELEGIGLCD